MPSIGCGDKLVCFITEFKKFIVNSISDPINIRNASIVNELPFFARSIISLQIIEEIMEENVKTGGECLDLLRRLIARKQPNLVTFW